MQYLLLRYQVRLPYYVNWIPVRLLDNYKQLRHTCLPEMHDQCREEGEVLGSTLIMVWSLLKAWCFKIKKHSKCHDNGCRRSIGAWTYCRQRENQTTEGQFCKVRQSHTCDEYFQQGALKWLRLSISSYNACLSVRSRNLAPQYIAWHGIASIILGSVFDFKPNCFVVISKGMQALRENFNWIELHDKPYTIVKAGSKTASLYDFYSLTGWSKTVLLIWDCIIDVSSYAETMFKVSSCTGGADLHRMSLSPMRLWEMLQDQRKMGRKKWKSTLKPFNSWLPNF